MLMTKKINIKELVSEYLNRIKRYDNGPNKLNSIIELNPDVLTISEKLDASKELYSGNLYGVPILLKDNISTYDRMHTSAGSLALANSIAKEDATIVTNLRNKGAVLLGKTNMTEFANHMTKGMPPGYSSRGGQVISPYNRKISPSGSSTGSAVAVSANLCMASFGTDTSGSIVTPAVKNGIVGFRPSLHALSQSGLIPISFTLDAVGPMTRTVMDSIILFSELSNTSVDVSEASVKAMTIGIDQTTLNNVSAEEDKKIKTLLTQLQRAGATLKYIKIPQTPTHVLKQIQLYEFKYSLNRYLETYAPNYPIRTLADIIAYNNEHPSETLRYGQTLLNDAEYHTRGDLSEHIYKDLLGDREKAITDVTSLVKGYDICITFISNLTLQYVGLPTITIPHGLKNDGTPFGLFLTAPNDTTLLKNAYAIEQVIGYRPIPSLL